MEMIVVPAGIFVPVTVMPMTRSATLASVTLEVVMLSVVVREAGSAETTAPPLLKTSAPEPKESIAPPAAVTVKSRSVFAPAPVYCSVPPLRISLLAALAEAPMELLAPPLMMLLARSVPALTEVTPV